jgi:hypothetical protein
MTTITVEEEFETVKQELARLRAMLRDPVSLAAYLWQLLEELAESGVLARTSKTEAEA